MAETLEELRKRAKANSPTGGRPPEGKYTCRVIGFGEHTTQDNGHQGVRAELRIIKGEHKGKDLRDLFLYQWRTGDLLDIFDKFGFDLSNVGKEAIPAMCEKVVEEGPKVVVSLKHNTKPGKEKYYFLSWDEVPTIVGNDAEDEDDEEGVAPPPPKKPAPKKAKAKPVVEEEEDDEEEEEGEEEEDDFPF